MAQYTKASCTTYQVAVDLQVVVVGPLGEYGEAGHGVAVLIEEAAVASLGVIHGGSERDGSYS